MTIELSPATQEALAAARERIDQLRQETGACLAATAAHDVARASAELATQRMRAIERELNDTAEQADRIVEVALRSPHEGVTASAALLAAAVTERERALVDVLRLKRAPAPRAAETVARMVDELERERAARIAAEARLELLLR